MARIRSVRPEFRTDLVAAGWPRDVRLFFTYLKCYADDFGKGVDEPRLIKADCFPVDDDVTAALMDDWLWLLARDGAVVRYETAEGRFLVIPEQWWDQKPQHPGKSTIPDRTVGSERFYPQRPLQPEMPHEAYGIAHEPFDTASVCSGEERREGEGSARATPAVNPPPVDSDPEPPTRCPQHIRAPAAGSCPPCGDYRRDHEAWERRQRARPTPGPPSLDCPRHPGQPARHCPVCTREASKPPPGFSSARRRLTSA